jgi:ADP-ribose pyrophosphatase YjhB (NUDIX family)
MALMQASLPIVDVALVNAGRFWLVEKLSDPTAVITSGRLPSGTIEPSEKPEDAAARIVTDALGCNVELRGVAAVVVDHAGGTPVVRLVFAASLAEGLPTKGHSYRMDDLGQEREQRSWVEALLRCEDVIGGFEHPLQVWTWA